MDRRRDASRGRADPLRGRVALLRGGPGHLPAAQPALSLACPVDDPCQLGSRLAAARSSVALAIPRWSSGRAACGRGRRPGAGAPLVRGHRPRARWGGSGDDRVIGHERERGDAGGRASAGPTARTRAGGSGASHPRAGHPHRSRRPPALRAARRRRGHAGSIHIDPWQLHAAKTELDPRVRDLFSRSGPNGGSTPRGASRKRLAAVRGEPLARGSGPAAVHAQRLAIDGEPARVETIRDPHQS